MDALEQLSQNLNEILHSFTIDKIQFGLPQMVEKAERETCRLFQNIAKAKPPLKSAYIAALKYLRGQLQPSEHQYEFSILPIAICEPIKEENDCKIIGHPAKLENLLQHYRKEAIEGQLWRQSWYGLLSAYFGFEIIPEANLEKSGCGKLREFLEETWPYISKTNEIAPDWVITLRENSFLLGKSCCAPFAKDVLAGRREQVENIAQKVGIPSTSWFWQRLIVAVVREACSLKDDNFHAKIDSLIDLLKKQPVYRDEAIELILNRYYQCDNMGAHETLKSYVIDRNVWKNPKLKTIGIATSWNRVSEDVWKMVLSWVTASNLKLFFEILAGRNGTDDGRFNFWINYLDQIVWSKLIFGLKTRDLARRDREIGRLLAEEENVSAVLNSSKPELDAFIIEIGDFYIVEFSITSNAAYIYRKSQLTFKLNAKSYSDHTSHGGLKAGYTNNKYAGRILHPPGWERGAAGILSSLGIYADNKKAPSKAQNHKDTKRTETKYVETENSTANNQRLECIIEDVIYLSKINYVAIEDMRNKGGRYWVLLDQKNSSFADQLRQFGFNWAESRRAWYWPEE